MSAGQRQTAFTNKTFSGFHPKFESDETAPEYFHRYDLSAENCSESAFSIDEYNEKLVWSL